MNKSSYNKILAVLVCCTALVIAGTAMPQGAYSRLNTNVPADISENELKAVVVEDFESIKDWAIESTPKKIADEKKNPIPVLDLKLVEGGPSDLIPERWSADKKGLEKKNCVGVHFRFKYADVGNSVHLLPPPETQWDDPTKAVFTFDPRTGTNIQERAIQLPGRAKGISVWVHGRGNDYTLEVWVKDFKGDVHILKYGSINFVGWRPMKVDIPSFIPQEVQSYPQTKVTKIVRFVIRSTPNTGPEEVFMFFDQVKILTDVFEVNFDGQALHKAFGESTGGGTKTDTPK
jgi:hypothetical protein